MKKIVLPLGTAIVLSVSLMSQAGAFTMTQKCVIANELCFVSRAGAGTTRAGGIAGASSNGSRKGRRSRTGASSTRRLNNRAGPEARSVEPL